MKRQGGGTELTGDFSHLPRRRLLRSLQAAALTLLLLGLSIGVGDASTAKSTPSPKSHAHVYLLRGAFNVFSLGMDEISDRLNQYGISTTVTNYLNWSSLAEEAAADYKSGRVRTIILVGHSSGATAVTEMAARLGELGVPVKLAIGLDPTSRLAAAGHVERYINYYVAHGWGNAVDRSRRLSGTVQNVDVEKDPDIGHFNIDKNRALQDKVVREIRAAAL
jgi:pimeloyl-ACP methyl ester carboxylesterase